MANPSDRLFPMKYESKMRVAMYYNNRDVRLEQVPVPKIGPGELLIKTRASGICGSDLMEWYRIKKAPLVLGHEITGEVTEVGEGVEDFKVGDRVFSSHHVPCGRCRYCLSRTSVGVRPVADHPFRSRRICRIHSRAENKCRIGHAADSRYDDVRRRVVHRAACLRGPSAAFRAHDGAGKPCW